LNLTNPLHPVTPIFVLYHANCSDGLGARYAAWKRFGEAEHIHYLAVQYGEPLPEIPDDSEVFILDFSYARDVLEALRARVKALVVLDHHKTAQEALEGFPEAIFDMAKSGAVLAWEYFHPEKPVPLLLQYVQDRDLWTWKLKGTKPLGFALPFYKDDMQSWDMLASASTVSDDHLDESSYLGRAVASGTAIQRYCEAKVEGAVKGVRIVQYNGGDLKCGLINATHLISEIGNEIYTKLDVDFSVSYFFHHEGYAVLSFRSQGDFDVSVLAKALGGGGHRNASGARVDFETWKLLHDGKQFC